jgi:cobalamin transport system substrate-binding protein
VKKPQTPLLPRNLGLFLFERKSLMPGSRNNRHLLPLFLAALVAAACPTQPARHDVSRRTITDGLGRSIAVSTEPRRIISLAPSITETLYALGLRDRVAGVTSYCDYPPEARSKEKVGDTIHPDLERIIGLKPDLVLVSTSSQLEGLTTRLDQLGIPVYVSNPRTVAQVVASIRSIGDLTGSNPAAAKLTSEMEQRISEVQQRVTGLTRPRVLYVLQVSPLITAGRDTFINDLIRVSGGDSISSQETSDYPQFSRETVIARAPELIVAPGSHGTEIVSVDELKRDFATTPAVRHGRIVLVDPDLVDRPGPRIVDGLEALSKAITDKAGTRK